MPLHSLARVEADPELVDELALIAQWLGGVDDTLGLAPLGGDKALLGGDIGVEDNALQAALAAAAEMGLGDHTHGEVGAGGAPVAQLTDVQAVQVVAAVVDVLVVGRPVGLGIALQRAGGREDGLPQLLHRLRLTQTGKQLFCPGLTGDSGNTPLVLVFDLVAVGLDDGEFGLLALGQLLLVDALQAVRVLREQVDAAGNGVHIVLPAGQLVILHSGKSGQAAVTDVELLQRLVVPVHHDLFGLTLIALVHQHGHKLRLVQVGGDEHLLPLLDIDAGAGDETGVGTENRLFHRECLLIGKISVMGIVPPRVGFEKRQGGTFKNYFHFFNVPLINRT